MVPTLAPGDLLLAFHNRRPAPGDVVVCDAPGGLVIVKRAVAGPGAMVELHGGVLEVDGVVVPRVLDIPGEGSWKVLDGHWFVLSDAPERTWADSRTFGPLPIGSIRGTVVARVWPRPRRTRG